MNKTAKNIFVFILFIFSISICQAQKFKTSDIVVSAYGGGNYDIEGRRPNMKSYGYMVYEASIGLQTNPEDGSCYSQAYGYPIFNFGFSLARTGNFRFYDQTKFNDLYTIYGSFERTLLRRKWFSLGYLLDFGFTYNPGKYDPVNNPGNNWLSSPVMAYVGAGAFASVHLGKRWEIGIDTRFRHYSNGRLALPNEALNSIGVGFFARYRLSDYDHTKYVNNIKKKAEYKKGMQYIISLGGGVHTCMAEWNSKIETESDPVKKKSIKLKAHPKLSLSADFLYRYSMRYASGISLEMYYSSNMEELRESDLIVYGEEAVNNCPGYSPISIGIALTHEVYWHNLAVHVSVGAYPYRHKGVNGEEAEKLGDRERGWHYEKAGLRYYFPKFGNTFLGFAVKAHSLKSEYLEFSAGIRL